MHKTLFPTVVASTMLLGGCAAGLGGGLGGGLLQTVLGGGQGSPGYSNQQFQQAAVNACGQQASRYGRVSISNVQQSSRDTLRVDGRIDTGDRYQRQFTCTFRSDGRIVDFRTN